MKFEQIRNATIVLEYADKKFLVDPWLAPQGSNGTFKELGMEKADLFCNIKTKSRFMWLEIRFFMMKFKRLCNNISLKLSF